MNIKVLRNWRPAFTITLIYMTIGILWIFYSDKALLLFIDDLDGPKITEFQTLKGVFYVLVTGILLIILIRFFTQKIYQSEAAYKHLFEKNPNPMFVYDRESLTFLAVNEAARMRYGYQNEDFLQMKVSGLRAKNQVPFQLKANENPLDGFNKHPDTIEHSTKSGEILKVEIYYNSVTFNGQKARLILAVDITDKLKVEEMIRKNQELLETQVKERTEELVEKNDELESLVDKLSENNEELIKANGLIEKQSQLLELQSEERLHTLLNHLREAVYALDVNDEKLEFISPFIERLSGRGKEEFLANPESFNHHIIPEDRKLRLKALMHCKQKGTAEVSYRINSRDGNLKWIDEKMTLFKREKDDRQWIYGALSDISDLKMSQQELINQNRDLEQFNFITSHNLRAPVARVLGLAEVVRICDANDPELPKYLAHIRDAAEQLDNTIKDLSKILEMKKGIQMKKEKVLLLDLLHEVIAVLDNTIEKSKAVMEIKVPEDLQIFAVKSYLNSIFYNLFSNSIKYKKEKEVPNILVKASANSHGVKIQFSDQGLGIDVERYHNKLFTLYSRFHDHVEGKGMGLYLVKTQVEAMNGTIKIESQPGQGTTFHFFIPN